MSSSNNSSWRKIIAQYEQASTFRSIWQLVNTCIPFFVLWYATYRSLSVSLWLTLGLAIATAGFMVRTFIIFHDCCHGSFFQNRIANMVIGTITGILTFSPYHQWRHDHNVHHASSGNLDKRGVGDIWTLTVDEYLALSPMQRLGYRLYRNPLVLFVIGPAFIFVINHRFNRKNAGRSERLNTYITNLGIALTITALCWAVGWKSFLIVEGLVFLLGGGGGVWLFYVQHNFEGTYFEHGQNWDYVQAALQGSSFYRLPNALNWITGSIGYHHIHHLSPRVPNYNLERAHTDNPMFQEVEPVTLRTSFRSLTFRIWDENRQKLVGFSYIKEYVARKGKEA